MILNHLSIKSAMFKNRIIVACSQNFNGYGMLHSLAEMGVKPTLIINHAKSPIIRLSRFKGEISYYNSVSEIPDILKEKYTSDSLRPIVICCDDAIQSIVDLHYDELKRWFILSNINDTQGEITRLMKKDIQMKLAAEAGITVPKTWFFKKGERVSDDVIYPIFAKTDISLHGAKSDMCICNNKEELQKAVNRMDYLVQEYIKKDYEAIIWGTSIGKNQYYIPSVSHKIRHLPIETGMTSFGVMEEFSMHPGLDMNAVHRFLNALDYTGMFSIEFAVKDNVYYFLEINLRNDGLQNISTVAGANLPKMYIQSMLSLPVEIPKVKTPTYYMGELTDYQHIGKTITFKEWYKCFKMTDCFFIANWKDPLPFVSELVTKVKDTIRYRLGLVK